MTAEQVQLISDIRAALAEGLSFIDNATTATITAYLDSENLWEVANTIGNYYNDNDVSVTERAACRSCIDEIRAVQGAKAKSSDASTTIVFGTSGWRGIIGETFTVLNVHKVVRGIVEMMQTSAFLDTNGYDSFAEVQKNGILVLRDNRYMGDLFMDAAMKELATADIKIHFAGECPTGVGSALLTELGGAGSINFTPSHNPMEYAGIKFNPADGGPADVNLTSIIEKNANAYMGESVTFVASECTYDSLKSDIDGPAMFTDFVLAKAQAFDLTKIRTWLEANAQDLALVVDYMHGSSRGYVQALLGQQTMAVLNEQRALTFLNEDEDFSFHGVKPEPSAKNQAPLIELLKKADKKYSLAVALDPDADRIRFADADLDVDMNRFGALAYAGLLNNGMQGGVASTAPSSDFGLEVAKQAGQKVFETAVGFKNFRAPLGSGQVLVCFEESDGISFIGHTLEKCALAGFVMALELMASQNKNISVQYAELQAKSGYFYPDKAGADVKGVSVEAWESYKREVVDILQNRLYKVGDEIEVGNQRKRITQINTIDGLKVIFEDKSWILLRPSGTEPKFRYYIELAATEPIADAATLQQAYIVAGGTILQAARDMVG